MLAVVAGSRNHKISTEGQIKLREILVEHKALIVFHGGCSGLDLSVKEFVEREKFLTITFEADWNRFGRGAGPKRNFKMVKYASRDPDAIFIRFFGGDGTKNCAGFAKEFNLKIIDMTDEKYVVAARPN